MAKAIVDKWINGMQKYLYNNEFAMESLSKQQLSILATRNPIEEEAILDIAKTVTIAWIKRSVLKNLPSDGDIWRIDSLESMEVIINICLCRSLSKSKSLRKSIHMTSIEKELIYSVDPNLTVEELLEPERKRMYFEDHAETWSQLKTKIDQISRFIPVPDKVPSLSDDHISSPEIEGWVGWRGLNYELSRDNALSGVIVGLFITLLLITLFFIGFLIAGAWRFPVAIVAMILSAAIPLAIFYIMGRRHYKKEYEKSLCPSCHMPWSQVITARKVIGTREMEVETSMAGPVLTRRYDPSTGSTWEDSTGGSTGDYIYTYVHIATYLYHSVCNKCGYEWNTKKKEVTHSLRRDPYEYVDRGFLLSF